MRTTRFRWAAVAVAALAGISMLAAACGDDDATTTPTSAPSSTTAAATTAATTAPASSATTAAATTAAATTAAASSPVKVGAATGHPQILTAAATGKSLYVFDKDTTGVSNCTGACAATWPPLALSSATVPAAPAGASGAFTVITRTDGAFQLAYNGKPLYFYGPDAAAGDINGDGVGGVWHLATP